MKSLVFITRDLVTRNTVEKLLKESYRLVFFSSVPSALDYIYTSMPDLIILDTALDDHWTGEILSELKSDPTFGQVPVLRICDEGVDMPSWDHVFVDDYVRRCSLEAETHSRVRLCLERSERFVDINPLTRLPGNIAITKEIQHRLDKGEGFCLAWADLDDFKPFNDRYGFARGDEVLKMMARLILNTVKEIQPQGAFVGHVGGDDFVFMVSCDVLPDVADRIIDNFDRIIPIFYDEDDRTKGFIESVDRMSRKHVFPIIHIRFYWRSSQPIKKVSPRRRDHRDSLRDEEIRQADERELLPNRPAALIGADGEIARLSARPRSTIKNNKKPRWC